MNIHTKIKHTTTLGSLLLITACGGGGGGDGSSLSSAPDSVLNQDNNPVTLSSFEPDQEKLASAADASQDLYVDAAFTFDANRSVHFFLNVSDERDRPLPDTVVKVYAVDQVAENIEIAHDMEKHLLFVGKTDLNGLLERSIELAPEVIQTIAIASAVGIDNQALIPIENDTVSHFF